MNTLHQPSSRRVIGACFEATRHDKTNIWMTKKGEKKKKVFMEPSQSPDLNSYQTVWWEHWKLNKMQNSAVPVYQVAEKLIFKHGCAFICDLITAHSQNSSQRLPEVNIDKIHRISRELTNRLVQLVILAHHNLGVKLRQWRVYLIPFPSNQTMRQYAGAFTRSVGELIHFICPPLC